MVSTVVIGGDWALTAAPKLNGTLNVSLLNGFIPDKSEPFQIMTFTSRSGDFTTQNFPSYSNYNVFEIGRAHV